jgi:hypothetical protein
MINVGKAYFDMVKRLSLVPIADDKQLETANNVA